MAHGSPLVVFIIKESYKLSICLLFTATTKYVTVRDLEKKLACVCHISGPSSRIIEVDNVCKLNTKSLD